MGRNLIPGEGVLGVQSIGTQSSEAERKTAGISQGEQQDCTWLECTVDEGGMGSQGESLQGELGWGSVHQGMPNGGCDLCPVVKEPCSDLDFIVSLHDRHKNTS